MFKISLSPETRRLRRDTHSTVRLWLRFPHRGGDTARSSALGDPGLPARDPGCGPHPGSGAGIGDVLRHTRAARVLAVPFTAQQHATARRLQAQNVHAHSRLAEPGAGMSAELREGCVLVAAGTIAEVAEGPEPGDRIVDCRGHRSRLVPLPRTAAR